MTKPQRHPFRTLFAFCFVLICAAGVIGYASGWINFKHETQKDTIQIETSKIKETAEEALKTGQEFIEKSGERLSEITTDETQQEKLAEPATTGDAEATNSNAPNGKAIENSVPNSDR